MTDPIDRLVDDLEPTGRAHVSTLAARFVLPALVLVTAAVALVIGLRPDMPGALVTASFWIKLISMSAIAVAAWLAVTAAARPGRSPDTGLIAGAALAGLLLIAGLVNLALAEPALRGEVLMGHSWRQCLPRVVLTALPVFAASVWVLRRMAPVRLRLAGLAAGLFAGAAGAAVYSLSCTETSVTFLAVWYQAAILAVAGLGALTGPRLLRW